MNDTPLLKLVGEEEPQEAPRMPQQPAPGADIPFLLPLKPEPGEPDEVPPLVERPPKLAPGVLPLHNTAKATLEQPLLPEPLQYEPHTPEDPYAGLAASLGITGPSPEVEEQARAMGYPPSSEDWARESQMIPSWRDQRQDAFMQILNDSEQTAKLGGEVIELPEHLLLRLPDESYRSYTNRIMDFRDQVHKQYRRTFLADLAKQPLPPSGNETVDGYMRSFQKELLQDGNSLSKFVLRWGFGGGPGDIGTGLSKGLVMAEEGYPLLDILSGNVPMSETGLRDESNFLMAQDALRRFTKWRAENDPELGPDFIGAGIGLTNMTAEVGAAYFVADKMLLGAIGEGPKSVSLGREAIRGGLATGLLSPGYVDPNQSIETQLSQARDMVLAGALLDVGAAGAASKFKDLWRTFKDENATALRQLANGRKFDVGTSTITMGARSKVEAQRLLTPGAEIMEVITEQTELAVPATKSKKLLSTVATAAPSRKAKLPPSVKPLVMTAGKGRATLDIEARFTQVLDDFYGQAPAPVGTEATVQNVLGQADDALESTFAMASPSEGYAFTEAGAEAFANLDESALQSVVTHMNVRPGQGGRKASAVASGILDNLDAEAIRTLDGDLLNLHSFNETWNARLRVLTGNPVLGAIDNIIRGGAAVLSKTPSGVSLKRIMSSALSYQWNMLGTYRRQLGPLLSKVPRHLHKDIRGVVEGRIITGNADLLAYTDAIKSIFLDLDHKFLATKHPGYRTVLNYFPRVWKPEALTALLKGKGSYYDNLVKKWGEANVKQIRAELSNQNKRLPWVRRSGFIDFERTLDDVPDEFLLDPVQSLDRYLDSATNRLAWASPKGGNLGWEPLPEKVVTLLDQIQQEGGAAQRSYASKIFRKLNGTWEPEGSWERALHAFEQNGLVRTLRTAEGGAKLVLAQILNLGQTSYTTVRRFGLRATAQGLLSSLTKTEREAVFNAGAIIRKGLSDMLDLAYLGSWQTRLLSKQLQLQGFTFVEMANQMVAANAGKHWLHRMAAQLHMSTEKATMLRKLYGNLMGEDRKQIQERLYDLGFSPQDVAQMQRTGLVTMAQEVQAMQQGNILTQFAHPNALHDPMILNEARTISQFKRFSFHAFRENVNMVRDVVPHPMRDPYTGKFLLGRDGWTGGNIKSLAEFVGVGGLTADQLRRFRLWMEGRSIEDEHWSTRLANDAAYMATGGIMADAIGAIGRRNPYKSMMEFAVGPTLSDVISAGMSIADVGEYNGLPWEAKTLKLLKKWTPAAKFEVIWARHDDHERLERRVYDIIEKGYASEGAFANFVTDLRLQADFKRPEWVGVETGSSFYAKQIRLALSGKPSEVGIAEYIAKYLDAKMQESQISLGAAMDRLSDSVLGPNAFERLPEDQMDETGIVPRTEAKDLYGEGNTAVLVGMQAVVWDKATEEQRQLIRDYVISSRLLHQTTGEVVFGRMLPRIVAAKLNLNKQYSLDELTEALFPRAPEAPIDPEPEIKMLEDFYEKNTQEQ